MSYYFSEEIKTDSLGRQKFSSDLDAFFSAPEHKKGAFNLNVEFKAIESFISKQPDQFLEETLLNTVSKILNNINKMYKDNYCIEFSTNFISILHNSNYVKFLDKIQKYGTRDTLYPIKYFLETDKISLANSFTNMFLLEQNRDVNGFPSGYNQPDSEYNQPDFIESCLKENKIAALNFLLDNYKGFNTPSNQIKFFKYSDMDDKVLKTVFTEKRCVTELYEAIKTFLNKDSITLDKKLEIIEYFSEKQVPGIMSYFLSEKIDKNIITFKSLSKYKFGNNLIKTDTILEMFNNKNSLFSNVGTYLNKLEVDNDKKEEIFLDIIKNHKEKINVDFLLSCIEEYPQIKENKELLEKALLTLTNLNGTTINKLSNEIDFSEEFKKIYIEKNEDSYLFFKDNINNKDLIDKTSSLILKNLDKFYELTKLFEKNNIFNNEYYEKLITELKTKMTPQELFQKLFLNGQSYLNFSDNLKKLKEPIVFDIDLKETNIKYLSSLSISSSLSNLLNDELKTKWYSFFNKEPLQIVFEKGEFRLIKDPKDVIKLDYSINSENIVENENSFDSIIHQSKKDLESFQKLINNKDCEFNLEFKIRAESIFMQQINFLNQIKKLENELDISDLYFLKNNLGKYLIQCTETYGRSLTRYQALIENPSLFKKSPEVLEAQKEKIDTEALKQITLLEKEMDMVKTNIINTINNESFFDMKVNTKILESTMSNEINYDTSPNKVVKIKQTP